MERQPISRQGFDSRAGNQQQPTQAANPASAGGRNMLLSIGGGGARIEGTFHIADSIDIECEVSGEMVVGGRLVIGEHAIVSADVQTLDAVIMGRYSGNLKASGSIEITSAGRVSGNLETNELVVAKGAIFTGTVTRPGDLPTELPVPQTHAEALALPEPSRPESAPQPATARNSTPPKASNPASQGAEEPGDTEETSARPRAAKPRPWS